MSNIVSYREALMVAGLAVSFAMVKPSINEAMPGVAISVSLVPPLAVVGVGLAKLDLTMASSAVILFLVNVMGIMFSAMVMFSLMKFISRKSTVRDEVIKDNRIVEKQNQAK